MKDWMPKEVGRHDCGRSEGMASGKQKLASTFDVYTNIQGRIEEKRCVGTSLGR